MEDKTYDRGSLTDEQLEQLAHVSKAFSDGIMGVMANGVDERGEEVLATGILTTAMVILFGFTDGSDDSHATVAMRAAEVMPVIANNARAAFGKPPLFEHVEEEDTE